MSDVRDAHEMVGHLHGSVIFPGHPPRRATPEYERTHKLLCIAQDTPCLVCRVRHSTLGDPTANWRGARFLETHHFWIQDSLVNAVGLDTLRALVEDETDQQPLALMMKAALGHIQTLEDLRAFVDSPANMIVLCLPGDAPVLMADGSETPIADVCIGDMVIGHDLKAHRVTGTMSRDVDEELVVIDGRRMTANHPILTRDGWKEASLVVPGEDAAFVEVGVLGSHVGGVAAVEDEVIEPVVGLVPILMVDALGAGKPTAQVLLHHPTVLRHTAPLAIPPDLSPAVALGCGVNGTQALGAWALGTVQRDDAAVIGAVFTEAVTDTRGGLGKHVAALLARHGHAPTELGVAARAGARARTGAIPSDEMSGSSELLPTDDAGSDRHRDGAALLLNAAWRPVNHVERIPFAGKVYDISIAGSRSFITDGLVVHNCDVCHVGYGGIHNTSWNYFIIQAVLTRGYVLFDEDGKPADLAQYVSLDEHLSAAAEAEQAQEEAA